MASVSLIVALMALAAAGGTLYRYRRMRGSLFRLEADLLSPEQKLQLFDGMAEIHALRAQLQQLRSGLNEDLQKLKLSAGQVDEKAAKIEQQLGQLQLAGNQLDDRITNIEEACSGLGAMSTDLEELQGFKDHVEQLHSRLRQALSGDSVKAQPLPGKPQIGLSRRA